MNTKLILGITGTILISIVTYGLYHSYITPECYDGYGGAQYVEKESFVKALSSAQTLDFVRVISLAQEVYRCGETTYLLKKSSRGVTGFTEVDVSRTEFNTFIESKNSSTTLFKIYQSGNSPYFAEDIQTGIEYIINQNDTGYNVEKALRV